MTPASDQTMTLFLLRSSLYFCIIPRHDANDISRVQALCLPCETLPWSKNYVFAPCGIDSQKKSASGQDTPESHLCHTSWLSGLEYYVEFWLATLVRWVVRVEGNETTYKLARRARWRRHGVSIGERRHWLNDVERGVPWNDHIKEDSSEVGVG